MRIGRAAWAAGMAALWPAALACAGQCTMAHVSRLALQPASGHVLVDATLNGGAAKLIFDTGAETSVLSEAAVDRLGLVHMQGEEVRNTLGGISGVGGGRRARFVTARTVNIGGLRGRDYNFMAADFPADLSDGLLSVDLVSQFDIDLDFPESQINLYRPTGDCSAPAAFLAGPLYSIALQPVGEDRRPRVAVSVNGHRLVALVDTGAFRSALFRSAASAVGLREEAGGERERVTIGGVGSARVASFKQVVPELSVGDLSFANMPVLVLDDASQDSDVQMVLGADFQARVHLWISYSSNTLIMQYPPRPSKKPSSPHLDAG